ncbi:MAG: hypothetical protein QXJ74_08705 [Nitrososphaera sp.]
MKGGQVAYVLAAISVVGAIAIPTGNPMFIDRAIAVEVAFITLTVLTFAGYKKQLYACFPLAALVIAGNSLAPPHVEIMTTFSKPFNAVILILGGYILQGLLVASAALEIARNRKAIRQEIS